MRFYDPITCARCTIFGLSPNVLNCRCVRALGHAVAFGQAVEDGTELLVGLPPRLHLHRGGRAALCATARAAGCRGAGLSTVYTVRFAFGLRGPDQARGADLGQRTRGAGMTHEDGVAERARVPGREAARAAGLASAAALVGEVQAVVRGVARGLADVCGVARAIGSVELRLQLAARRELVLAHRERHARNGRRRRGRGRVGTAVIFAAARKQVRLGASTTRGFVQNRVAFWYIRNAK